MSRYLRRLDPLHVAAATLVSLLAVGLVFIGEEELIAHDAAASLEISGGVLPAPPVEVPEATVDRQTPVPIPDGATGPVASGTTPAERISPPVQVTDTLPPPPSTTEPAPVGLHGMPFAPDGLSGCDEMEWYRAQAGLPADFDWIGFAESSCKNHVNTWCCWGYWQIHELHIGTGSAAACGVDEIDDMVGRSGWAKQRNACMAARVLDQQGVCAWDVVRCRS